MTIRESPLVSPFWVPGWKSIEPWRYNPRKHKKKYASKLLASIMGHNLCLGWFGDPSEDEVREGLECHGEASIVKWRLISRKATRKMISLTCGCRLPVARMDFVRTITMRADSNVADVKEEIRSLAGRDLPFTMCQHVTLGAPFLKKGVTVFDMPATKCHTFPGKFGAKQRLKRDRDFVWPRGPGAAGGTVNMRLIGSEYRSSSDFTANLMNTGKSDAWFSAVNPEKGLLLAYIWRRADFPWVGNWEENLCRKQNPWRGRELTRGMEFANTPFPVGLRRAVSMGTFQGQPACRWLPAGGGVNFEYSIVLAHVPSYVKGVKDVRRTKKGFTIITRS